MYKYYEQIIVFSKTCMTSKPWWNLFHLLNLLWLNSITPLMTLIIFCSLLQFLVFPLQLERRLHEGRKFYVVIFSNSSPDFLFFSSRILHLQSNLFSSLTPQRSIFNLYSFCSIKLCKIRSNVAALTTIHPSVEDSFSPTPSYKCQSMIWPQNFYYL